MMPPHPPADRADGKRIDSLRVLPFVALHLGCTVILEANIKKPPV